MQTLYSYFYRVFVLSFFITTCFGMSTSLANTLSVHPVILDFSPDQLQRANLEIKNQSQERIYVAAEPARIEKPGTTSESRVLIDDPEELGLLASPPRVILEPGERRFIRVAALMPPGDKDRIFRLAVKPVVGELSSEKTGLKVLVGYDVLVIQRPITPNDSLTWDDKGHSITIKNTGNSNVQIVRGEACSGDELEQRCTSLQPHRLYAGNEVEIDKIKGTVVSYDVVFMGRARRQTFD